MPTRGEGIVKAAKTASLVVSGLSLILGIILAVWSEELATLLRFLIGVDCLLLGAVKIFGYFSNDLYRIAYQFDLAAGGIIVFFGVLLLAFPHLVMPHLVDCIAITVLFEGLLRIQTSIDAKRFGMDYWYLLLLGAVLLSAGAVAVFLTEAAGRRTVFIGILLIASAFVSVIVTMYTVKVRVRKVHREDDFPTD